MSREIKFRAWVGSENTSFIDMPSHYEYDVVLKDGCYADVESGWDIQGVFSLVPIEQYTGLKDKNGKEIYEGDIVEEDIDFNSKMTDGTFRYKVYWNEDELCWSLDHIGSESIHNDLWELNSSRRIIGNIHENPELLEDENE